MNFSAHLVGRFMAKIIPACSCLLVLFSICVISSPVLAKDRQSPHLVVSYKDLADMRNAIVEKGRFAKTYQALKLSVDNQIAQPIEVPVPADGGGGYTHERHKKNYQLMYNAGVIYQISQQDKYALFVRDMLLAYTELYPTLGLHPKRKVKSQNPGKLFWQSLNEAVWLVHTIQAYDLIVDSLSEHDKMLIEDKLLTPVVLFLSEGQPSTFNKVHNHGTWATAGVGMAGYVLGNPDWVEQALYDLEKSGKGGFLKQLDELFSPQGYYNEGPYYQRYALMPFVTFAKAIQANEPERKIFEYRDGVLLKAIKTTVDLSYNGLFFGINDAIKSKGIDTIELVNGITIAYGLTQNSQLLDIANQQQQIILTGDGLKVAKALDAGLATPYQFSSVALGDGANGNEGALIVMRQSVNDEQQALVFKPAAQGLGHGHFDKLAFQFFDKGEEIVSDYGAARFLNVEAKYGGRYLPENGSYAKQTVAHNTVVVDEKSHFNSNTKVGNKHHPNVAFFETTDVGTVASASIDTAYPDVLMERSMALVRVPTRNQPLSIDIFKVSSERAHQYDLPLHYQGHLIESNFKREAFLSELKPLGEKNGYQHLWLTGEATPKQGVAKITWLNKNGKFYTHSSIVDGDTKVLFTQIGANDPNFNLRNESSFIYRASDSEQHTFVSVIEPHGQYNPGKEFTLSPQSSLSGLEYQSVDGLDIVEITLEDSGTVGYLLVINNKNNNLDKFTYKNNDYQINGRLNLIQIKAQQ
ncbi:hypothetical protein tloyanaT_17470 [Thalassotalea loyana]|uniref:Alginate lyase n=1 Tax=Thalassotalea loyana TaxID=280483 RepID=A0ABQ6HFG8_9GAMM|nr:heparinase II/III family protein [Thalassotalea loyana]GLX85495.1 hypothetical protein tloyanaT_17470 [Thalassotalea loyana]